MNKKMTFCPLTETKIPALLELICQYYAYDHLAFDADIAASRLHELLSVPDFGRAWFIEVNGATAGYLILTLGFGLEHGRNATIDEFFLLPNFRGQGLGKDVARFIQSEVEKFNVVSLHAEVEHANDKALAFWTSVGFTRLERHKLVKMIP